MPNHTDADCLRILVEHIRAGTLRELSFAEILHHVGGSLQVISTLADRFEARALNQSYDLAKLKASRGSAGHGEVSIEPDTYDRIHDLIAATGVDNAYELERMSWISMLMVLARILAELLIENVNDPKDDVIVGGQPPQG